VVLDKDTFPWDRAPRHLIRDRDGAHGEIFKQRLHAMGIRDRPTAPRSPWQNAYVERLIGSIRRDRLDHLIIVDERYLRSVLRDYAAYYNRFRTHCPWTRIPPAIATILSNAAVDQRRSSLRDTRRSKCEFGPSLLWQALRDDEVRLPDVVSQCGIGQAGVCEVLDPLHAARCEIGAGRRPG
jgi:transposase InsO family protein